MANNIGTVKINRLEKAFARNVKYCVFFEIGGMENSKIDGDEPEYYELLEKHDALVDYIYDCAVNVEYGEGMQGCWGSANSEWRFLGSDKMRAICEAAVVREGY